jgi:hypothetical protein
MIYRFMQIHLYQIRLFQLPEIGRDFSTFIIQNKRGLGTKAAKNASNQSAASTLGYAQSARQTVCYYAETCSTMGGMTTVKCPHTQPSGERDFTSSTTYR